MPKCPNCGKEYDQSLTECPNCGLIFAKWHHSKIEPVVTQTGFPLTELRLPAIVATLTALGFTSHFRSYLPIPQGWASLETLWLPLSAINVVFHEAGHWIFGILGLEFLMVAGGTLMQLMLPAACLFEFWRQKSGAGIGAVLFWLGENLVAISYYAADAKMQVIILITGMSGSEGGYHDWGYMLGQLGLKNYCVGLAQIIFFAGCWLMAFAPTWGARSLFKKLALHSSKARGLPD